MNSSLLIFTSILCFFFFTGPKGIFGYLWPRRNTYMTRWDKVNLDEILDSKRLLQHYFNCLMSRGPCPPDGMELKSEFSSHFITLTFLFYMNPISMKEFSLLRLNKQGNSFSRYQTKNWLIEFEPERFEKLANKYDPEGTYRRKYLEPSPDDNRA
ncbi:ejaculatory bulb-specific protein 3-like [Belonocnema kinseyi]|uniref:ejaculatory bulb-specific protein 3-like n=1 Tax=Belonocnema kinseyi TaxID=2817044 RepID=UPI00143D46CA|nr:ejaculatory bulb-specific protein 3-like [Belonocnema kinseyi]